MTNASMREFVKTEAAKTFDGDNDILVQRIGQQRVSTGTFEQLMVRADGKRTDFKARKATFAVDNYVRQQPLLNISVPVHIDEWEAGSYEPLVVVSPNVANESRVKRIKAFDSKGNVHWLDGRIAPKNPVVVVGLNERVKMDAAGQWKPMTNLVKVGSSKSKRTPGDLNLVQQPDDGTGTGGGGGGTGGGGAGGGGSTCYFTQDAWLQIPRMDCNDISVVESWDRGLPEICFQVVTLDKNAVITSANVLNRVAPMPQEPAFRIPGTWGGYGYSPWRCFSVTNVVQWTTEAGDILGFKFWEQDNGGTDTSIDFTVGLTLAKWLTIGFKIPINLGNGDDEIGNTVLYRCKSPQAFDENGQPFQVIQKDNSNFWIFFKSA